MPHPEPHFLPFSLPLFPLPRFLPFSPRSFHSSDFHRTYPSQWNYALLEHSAWPCSVAGKDHYSAYRQTHYDPARALVPKLSRTSHSSGKGDNVGTKV